MRKYGPWYWIRPWLLCRDRSAAARRCACIFSCWIIYQCVYMFTSVCTCLPVCVHVYQCMYMSTSVCTCLPVCVNVYHHGAVQLIDTHISGTQTPNTFFRQISQLKTSICVCVWVFFSVSFLDLCGRKRRFPANRQAGRQNRHQTWEWIQRVPPFSVSWVSFFNLWSWSATLFDCCCSFKSPRLSCLLLGPQAASNSSNI